MTGGTSQIAFGFYADTQSFMQVFSKWELPQGGKTNLMCAENSEKYLEILAKYLHILERL